MEEKFTHYCPKCMKDVDISDTDWFERKTCPVCGMSLEITLDDSDDDEG